MGDAHIDEVGSIIAWIFSVPRDVNFKR